MKIHRLRSLLKPRLKSLNCIEIDDVQLLRNLSYLESLRPWHAIFPVLKSNAYGHGINLVSKILSKTQVPYICVDSFPEYQIVRDWAKQQVLILWETFPQNYTYYNPKHAAFAVYNLATLRHLASQRSKYRIHLFLNTGMNREWLQRQQLDEALKILQQSSNIQVEWVMSHYANADETNSALNFQQMQNFKVMHYQIKQAWFQPRRLHISNTAGLAKTDDSLFTASRAGIWLYGYNPLHHEDPHFHVLTPLQWALRAYTTIVALQQLQTWDIVSYWWNYVAAEDQTTATVPFGYFEGLPRAVSWTWQFKRKEHYIPQLGRICMNLCSCGTMQLPMQIGDRIEVIGDNHLAPNSIVQLAKQSGTIPYEILVKLQGKTKRVIASNK